MTDSSAGTPSAVHRLLAAALTPASPEPTTHDQVAASERTVMAVAETLTRWFGPYGYHALLIRALGEARATHPVLADVRPHSTLQPVLDGLGAAAATHGGSALADGIASLLAAIVALLGRVVGDQMALQLLERSMRNVVDSPISDPGSSATDIPAVPGDTSDGGAA